jgi:hypothetical protein
MLKRCVVELTLADHGGEGRRRNGVVSSASTWWRQLHLRANHAMAMFATAICGRKGGPLRRLHGVLLNLQCGGLPPSFSPESATSRRQVVCPRRCQDGRRWNLSPQWRGPWI